MLGHGPAGHPHYESYLADFHEVVGSCPRTTTALGHKDVGRTRQLLELTRSLGPGADRLSIGSVDSLNRLHAAFTAEELLRVECVPRNPEAAESIRSPHTDRARQFPREFAREFARTREAEPSAPDVAPVPAGVSGFLIGMTDRTVQLVTPCVPSDRWPLGHWVLGRGRFSDAAGLSEVIEGMIARNMRAGVGLADPVRLRRDARLALSDGELRISAAGRHVAVCDQPDLDDLAACLREESPLMAIAFATRRNYRSGVAPEHTFAWLDHLFEHGLLDEEPEPEPLKAVAAGAVQGIPRRCEDGQLPCGQGGSAGGSI